MARPVQPDSHAGLRPVSEGARFTLLLGLLLGALLLPGALEGQGRELVIEDFDAEITVHEDGSFDVVETLRVHFIGSWNGLERELFFDHETAEGRRTRYQLELGEVTDAAGRPLEVEESGLRRGLNLRVWVPDANDAVRTIVLRYRIDGGLRFFDGDTEAERWDELYYNVTGHGWRVPIEAARARVHLPAGLEPTGAWGYTGHEGSNAQDVQIQESGSTVEIRATESFLPGEGLTISVTWPAGVVERPSAVERARAEAVMYWPLGMPVVALVGMLGLWMTRGRDPDAGSVMVEYEPPEGLSPAEVGTLVDHKAQMHDITSTLVDLAVRGYLEIEEVEKGGGIPFFGMNDEDWIFRQTKPVSSWKELAPHERAYIEGVFEEELKNTPESANIGRVFSYLGDTFSAWREARRKGDDFDVGKFRDKWYRERRGTEGGPGEEQMAEVKLSDLEHRFYKHVQGIRTRIYRALKRRGLYVRRPDHQVGRWVAMGTTLLFGSVFLAIVAAEPPVVPQLFPEPIPLGLGMALSGLAVLVVGQGMGVRTEEGSRIRNRILGFREFLERVESDYYDRVVTSPELFEKYLPFAIALKVEGRWAKAFEDIYREPPDWYHGSGGSGSFRPSAFASSMNSLSSRAGRTMSSSPSSSGSGGGGSSGGGSGGGGGGGF